VPALIASRAMGERTSYTPGTFCWVDLVSGDQDASKAFYGDLFGWDYQDLPIGEDTFYSVAQLGGKPVAAVVPLPDPSVPPHWNCYVSVEDADAAAARAHEIGGTVVLPAGDVGASGRLAVIRDPQGALISVWQPGEHFGAAQVNGPGLLSWNDLLSPDVEASAGFYRELFGWTIDPIPGAEGQYWSIANRGKLNGGMMPMPPGGHPAWNLYFGVDDAEAAMARAGELGAQTVMGPMDVPSGRFVVLRDPHNAVFSVVDGQFDP
jgi:predicted enzyme related to lactoylglutathione lyase